MAVKQRKSNGKHVDVNNSIRRYFEVYYKRNKLRILIENNKVLVCNADICEILGLKNHARVLLRLDPDGIFSTFLNIERLDKKGVPHRANIIYKFLDLRTAVQLLATSHKKEAENLKVWFERNIKEKITKFMIEKREIIDEEDLNSLIEFLGTDDVTIKSNEKMAFKRIEVGKPIPKASSFNSFGTVKDYLEFRGHTDIDGITLDELEIYAFEKCRDKNIKFGVIVGEKWALYPLEVLNKVLRRYKMHYI